jgi:hypothetical protein
MRDAAGTFLCSCCGLPRGTYRDGRPRKDRYCAKCRAKYEADRRAAKRKEFAVAMQRLRALEAIVAQPVQQGVSL